MEMKIGNEVEKNQIEKKFQPNLNLTDWKQIFGSE